MEQTTAMSGLTFRLTPASAAYWREWTADLGAIVTGRTVFDVVDNRRPHDRIERGTIPHHRDTQPCQWPDRRAGHRSDGVVAEVPGPDEACGIGEHRGELPTTVSTNPIQDDLGGNIEATGKSVDRKVS